ncbi:MAG TPA: hypothetical protein VJN18_34805 [Polyangiaceae bacterium]|nr:hypothetical protein [Polyangiaceae bacterium]
MRVSTHPPSVPSDTARRRVRLLLKELGSRPLTSGGAADFDETLVIVQTPGEPPAAFAQRAIDRIAALERSGRCFDAARFLTGTQCDPESSAARRRMTLTVASHAQARGGMSELVLDADATGDGRVRAELLELVDELLSNPDAHALPIRVRFSPALPSSHASTRIS